MNNNNTLLIIVATLGVLYIFKDQLLGSGGNSSGERFFQVPGVGPVPESQLRNYGYNFLYGQWLTPQQTQQVLALYQQQTGNTTNNPQSIATWINTVGSAVLGIIQAIGGNGSNGDLTGGGGIATGL